MGALQLENEDTKKKILHVAQELFSKHGFSAVSIRQIAQAASCNVAALNYYFGSKKKLYEKCILAMDHKIKLELDQILVPPQNREEFENTFRKFCLTVTEFIIVNASPIKLLINEINAEDELAVIDPFLKPIREALGVFLNQAKEKGLINPDIEVDLFGNMVICSIICQKLYKSFQTYIAITDEELAEKILLTVTKDFYVNIK